MPKVAEVVHITTKKNQGGGKPMTSLLEQVETDQGLAEAASLVWLAFQEDAIKSGQPFPSYGQEGYKVEKSLHATVSFLWPTLGEGDYRDDPESFRVRQRLGRYLKYTGNLICLRRGNRVQRSVWWVRSEWNAAPPVYPADHAAKDKGVEEEPKADEVQAVIDAGEETFGCKQCPAVFLTAKGEASHRAMLKGRPHPQMNLPCALCPMVLSDVQAIINHVQAHHAKHTGELCRQCGRMFATHEDREEHLATQHPDRFKRQPKPVPAEPDLSPIEAVRLAAGLYSDLCAEHDELRKENAELRTANEALSEQVQKYAKLEEALRGINS